MHFSVDTAIKKKSGQNPLFAVVLSFLFVIQIAVTVPFKIWILDLLLKLAAHTFGVLSALAAARAVAPCAQKPLFNRFYNFLVLVISDFHNYLYCSINFTILALGT